MVQSMSDKLRVPVIQLFVQDKKLKKRVVEDILCEAINSRDNMDIDFIDENHPESAVQIEFPINRMNSYCTRQEVNIYCAELMNYRVTNELPNNEKVFSTYLVRLYKGDGVYSICLSGRSNNIQDTSYIYEMIEIYSEEHGRLQEFIDDCIEFELHNLSEENQPQTSGDNEKYVGDITFINFKLGHVGELSNHIKEELALVNVEDYVDKDVYIKLKKPFHLRAQNKRNRTGYGWEWDWSNGYGDYIEGTLYGETTDYVFAGIYISSSYTYEQTKRKKTSAKVNSSENLENEQVNYYKVVVDGYVKGEYTLIVSSSLPSFKSKNKRIQLFIKAERAGKDKYIPVACDTTDKLLYMNRATFDYYRAQINRQNPLVLHKIYVE